MSCNRARRTSWGNVDIVGATKELEGEEDDHDEEDEQEEGAPTATRGRGVVIVIRVARAGVIALVIALEEGEVALGGR